MCCKNTNQKLCIQKPLNGIFNEQMTSNEARLALFKAVEGKTKAEIEQIMSMYSKILPQIFEREHQLASKGWFID